MTFTLDDIVNTRNKIFSFKYWENSFFGNYQPLLTKNQHIKFKTLINEIKKCERIKTPPAYTWADLKIPIKDLPIAIKQKDNDLLLQIPADGNNKFSYNSRNPRKKLCENWIDSLGIEEEYITSLINAFLDIMLYSVRNNRKIELKKIGMISKEQWKQILKPKRYTRADLEDIKNKFNNVMLDGYMKDVYLKTIDKELEDSEIRYTYSIIDLLKIQN